MRFALALLTLLALGLWFADRALSSRATQTALRVERTIPAERSESLVVAALRLEHPRTKAKFAIVRAKGLWRVADATAAVCDSRIVEGLVQALRNSHALQREVESAARPSYGLGDDAWTIKLCGAQSFSDPAEDVLFALRVGHAFDSRSSFAERVGESRVLEVDLDLRSALDSAERAGHAPFLDLRLVAGPFPGAERSIDRVFVDRVDGSALELVRTPRETNPDAAGEVGWAWQLVVDGIAKPCPLPRAESYLAYLMTVPVAAALPPKNWKAIGIAKPDARLTLISSSGESMVFELAFQRDEHRALALNGTLGTLSALELELAEPCVASADVFLDLDRKNPWDTWLREHLKGPR